MNKPVLRNLSPGLQLLAFLLIVFLVLSLFSLLALTLVRIFTDVNLLADPSALKDYEQEGVLTARRILVIINHLGMFLIPSLIFARLVAGNEEDYLLVRKKPAGKKILLILLVAISSFAVTNFLYSVNQKMDLPDSMDGIEMQMEQMEEESLVFTEATLGEEGFGIFILNLLMLAVLPAIGEEFFFRGILQQLFNRILKHPHIAIWVTAFVFSFIHFQFYGFLPRMMWGVLLGYVFFWTGNIWYSVVLHLLNNGTAVLLSYLVTKGELDAEAESFGSSQNEMIPLVVSTLVLAGSIIVLSRNNRMPMWREKV